MRPERPYKGLSPYDQHDRDNFFGREHEQEVLLGKILSHKLTLLYAASGVGKSSLLGAAVIPELEDLHQENLDVAYHRFWIDEPIPAIQATVKQTLCRRKKIVEEELYRLDDPSLPAFFERCADYSSEPLVLVLDQFEELFRYHADMPYFLPFVGQLSEVITNKDLPLHVVLSMREDFLAELSVFRGSVPTLYDNYYRLQKLTLRQAREAIVKPLQEDGFGFVYEAGLLEELLQDLAQRERKETERRQPDSPQRAFVTVDGPYLQIVCLELWNREQSNPDKVIRRATYKTLGGANAIVKRYFEGIMAHCTPAQRRLAARAFAFLATELGTKIAYPEQVLAKILRVKFETLRPVLEMLKTARVLRDEERPEGTWYELYHDVFARIIEEWSRTFQAKRRRRVRLGVAALILAFVCTLGLTAYQGYQIAQQKARIANNAGTLHVRNPLEAMLTLTCIRHYHPDRACPEGTIPLMEKSVDLPGPADYMLTARQSDWVVAYPVYIDGITHQLTVVVEPPPKPIPPDMVYISGGIFRMGDKNLYDVAGLANERPHHDVEISGFWMDAHEVTNDQYNQCVQAGACSESRYENGTCYNPMGYQIDATLRNRDKPVVCVDWLQAITFCQYANKRLPTEAEWEKAAAGPEGYIWAFGNVFDPSRANTSESGKGTTTSIRAYAPNSYGLYDMSGNAMEWVEDWYDAAFYEAPEATQKNPVNRHKGGGRRVQRGGAWWHGIEGVRTTRRYWSLLDDVSTLVGFRCARSLTQSPDS